MANTLAAARTGSWVIFFLTGALSATWAARIPAVQERLHLTPGGLALAVLGLEAGALVGLPLGAAAVTRVGTRTSMRLALVVFAPGVLIAAVAPSLSALCLGLAIWATANSVLDVALNAEGVELEHRYRRPVLSSLHAAQSLGLLAGALTATLATIGEVSLLSHLALVAACSLLAGLGATVPLLTSWSAGPLLSRPSKPLVLMGAVAFCAFLVDGAASNWIAVHLRTEHGASQTLAAAGYMGFTAALTLGRLRGDRLTRRYPRFVIIRACGLAAFLGTATIVLAPTGPVAFAGWIVVGLTLAPMAPTVLGAAPRAATTAAPAAIATVSTLGYLGSFTGPPLIGALAEVWGLSAALSLLALAGAVAATLARTALGPVRHTDG